MIAQVLIVYTKVNSSLCSIHYKYGSYCVYHMLHTSHY